MSFLMTLVKRYVEQHELIRIIDFSEDCQATWRDRSKSTLAENINWVLRTDFPSWWKQLLGNLILHRWVTHTLMRWFSTKPTIRIDFENDSQDSWTFIVFRKISSARVEQCRDSSREKRENDRSDQEMASIKTNIPFLFKSLKMERKMKVKRLSFFL